MVMASQAATASMVSMIPVVVAGGIVWKFAEAMVPGGQQQRTRRRRPSRRVRDSYSRNDSGDFSNIGF